MALINFEDYGNKYSTIKMERREGILQMTLHTNNAELKWGMPPHEELSYAFNDIARDHENRCVIITGTGNAFCAEADAAVAAELPSRARAKPRRSESNRLPGTTSTTTPSTC